ERQDRQPAKPAHLLRPHGAGHLRPRAFDLAARAHLRRCRDLFGDPVLEVAVEFGAGEQGAVCGGVDHRSAGDVWRKFVLLLRCDSSMKEKTYQSLPGRGRRSGFVSFGIASGWCSLWLGPDHLLAVDSKNYQEEYKRFYYRDIQAFIARRTKRVLAMNI